MKTLKIIIVSLAVLATLALVATYMMTGTFIPYRRPASSLAVNPYLQGQEVIASSNAT